MTYRWPVINIQSSLPSLSISLTLSLTLSYMLYSSLSSIHLVSLSLSLSLSHTHTYKGRAYDSEDEEFFDRYGKRHPANGRLAGRVEQEVDGGNGSNEAGAMIAWDVSDIHCEGRVNVGPQGYYLTGGRYARGGKELGQFTGEMQRAEMWGKQDPRDPGGIVQLDGVTLEPTQMCGHINVYRVTEVKGRQTKKEKDGASGNTGPHAIVRSLTGSGSGGAPASCDIRRGDVLVKLNNVNVIGKPLEKLCFDAPLEAIFWQPSQNAGVWSVEILPIDSDEDPELPRNPRNSNNDIDAAACTSLETGLGRRTVVGAVEHEVVFSSYPMPLIDTQGGTVGGGASGAEGAAAVGSATSGATSTGGAAGGFVPVISMHPGFEATLNLGHTTPFAHPDMEEVRRWAVRESGGHLDDGGGGAGAALADDVTPIIDIIKRRQDGLVHGLGTGVYFPAALYGESRLKQGQHKVQQMGRNVRSSIRTLAVRAGGGGGGGDDGGGDGIHRASESKADEPSFPSGHDSISQMGHSMDKEEGWGCNMCNRWWERWVKRAEAMPFNRFCATVGGKAYRLGLKRQWWVDKLLSFTDVKSSQVMIPKEGFTGDDKVGAATSVDVGIVVAEPIHVNVLARRKEKTATSSRSFSRTGGGGGNNSSKGQYHVEVRGGLRVFAAMKLGMDRSERFKFWNMLNYIDTGGHAGALVGLDDNKHEGVQALPVVSLTLHGERFQHDEDDGGGYGAGADVEGKEVEELLRGYDADEEGGAVGDTASEFSRRGSVLTRRGRPFGAFVGLMELNLSHMGAGKRVDNLVEYVSTSPFLRFLNLSHNGIGDRGITQFSRVLGHANRLLSLDLSHNGFGEQGAEKLSDALELDHTLTSLNVSNNRVKADGMTALADALGDHRGLTWLDVSSNEVGHAGAAAIERLLRMAPALTSVNAKANSFGPTGALRISRALRLKNGCLTHLDLSDNNIGPKGCAHIAKALCGPQAPCLERLVLGSGNNLRTSMDED
jgi:hypothetical protein